jgi:hypothetical protein
MMNVVVAAIGHNRLDYIKRRIIEGHARTEKSGADWVEGSLQVAAALLEGREIAPADVSFSGWLKQNGLDFYNVQDRAALLNFATDIELARKVLSESNSRSYQTIWAHNKTRFSSTRKPRTRRKRTDRVPTHLFRTMKLGEEVMKKIKSTSLDSAAEMDELIMLNRGAPAGEQTPIVKQLIERASAGENVSAIATGKNMVGASRRGVTKTDLLLVWKKRMVAPWQIADQSNRVELLVRLAIELDQDHRNKLIEKLWDAKS